MSDRVHYWGLCQECNLDYYYLNGFPELPQDFTDSQWGFNADMKINLDILQRTLVSCKNFNISPHASLFENNVPLS